MSRKSTDDDQFVRWEDLDLSTLLGDFTDCDEADQSSSDDADVEKLNKSSERSSCKKVMYECPQPGCKRVYRTITGFRGHVTKKHQLHDLKAAQHVIGIKPAESQASHFSPADSTVDNLEFPEVLRRAFLSIETDEENHNSQSRFGHIMVEIARAAQNYLDGGFGCLLEPFKNVVQFGHGISKSADRELLMQRFLRLCNDVSIREELRCLLIDTVNVRHPVNVINMFIRIFLEECLNSYLTRQNERLRKDFVKLAAQVSDNDNDILQYVSGYIITKLLRAKTVSPANKTLLATFVNDANSKENFPAQRWTVKLDRGGLKYPKKCVYDLFLTAEITMRQHLDLSSIGPQSLSKAVLLERLLEAERVKRAWTLVVPGFCQNMVLCEQLLSLFLTIRGFATAKYIRRQFEVKKKSKALRKTLKPNKS